MMIERSWNRQQIPPARLRTDELIRSNTGAVLDRASCGKMFPRAAAIELARMRAERSTRIRRCEH
jgi:hypothetical protein